MTQTYMPGYCAHCVDEIGERVRLPDPSVRAMVREEQFCDQCGSANPIDDPDELAEALQTIADLQEEHEARIKSLEQEYKLSRQAVVKAAGKMNETLEFIEQNGVNAPEDDPYGGL